MLHTRAQTISLSITSWWITSPVSIRRDESLEPVYYLSTYLPTYPISYLEKSTTFWVDRRFDTKGEEKEKKSEWVENVSKVSLSDEKREKVVGILPSGADSSSIYIYVYI